MLGVDLPVLRRDGTVEHLTSAGLAGALNLPALSQQLYHSARWLRVFAARRMPVNVSQLRSLVTSEAAALKAALAEGRPLLDRAS
jgi:hypothetical protein